MTKLGNMLLIHSSSSQRKSCCVLSPSGGKKKGINSSFDGWNSSPSLSTTQHHSNVSGGEHQRELQEEYKLSSPRTATPKKKTRMMKTGHLFSDLVSPLSTFSPRNLGQRLKLSSRFHFNNHHGNNNNIGRMNSSMNDLHFGSIHPDSPSVASTCSISKRSGSVVVDTPPIKPGREHSFNIQKGCFNIQRECFNIHNNVKKTNKKKKKKEKKCSDAAATNHDDDDDDERYGNNERDAKADVSPSPDDDVLQSRDSTTEDLLMSLPDEGSKRYTVDAPPFKPGRRSSGRHQYIHDDYDDPDKYGYTEDLFMSLPNISLPNMQRNSPHDCDEEEMFLATSIRSNNGGDCPPQVPDRRDTPNDDSTESPKEGEGEAGGRRRKDRRNSLTLAPDRRRMFMRRSSLPNMDISGRFVLPTRRSSMKQSSDTEEGQMRCQERRESIGYKGEIEVELPGQEQPVKRRTSIGFEGDVQVCLVDSISSLGASQNEVWFQQQEYKDIACKAVSTIQKSEQTQNKHKRYCLRGLEKFLSPRQLAIKKKQAWGSVLLEQHLQRSEGDFDENHIAEVYQLSTKRSQLEAKKRATKDAEDAERYLRNTRKRYRRMSL